MTVLRNVVSAATINADGDASRGRVHLLLVMEDDPHAEDEGQHIYRWWASDDGLEWHDAGPWGRSIDDAEEAAQVSWGGDPEWGLEWPWQHGERCQHEGRGSPTRGRR